MLTVIDRKFRSPAEPAEVPKGATNGKATTAPTLADTDKAFAWECISKAYNAYWGKDGVKDLTDKLETLVETSYRHQLYQICRRSVQVAKNNLPAARVIFAALTDYAETQLKAEHVDKASGKLPAINDLLPSWGNYKSQMFTALDQKVNPLEIDKVSKQDLFPNASQFITRGKELKKAVDEANGGSNAGGSVVTLELAAERLSPELRGVMVALSQTIDGCPPELQSHVTEMLAHVNNSIATLIADFQQRMNAAGNDLSRSAEIAESMVGRKVAVATTGDAEKDARAAERIRKENAGQTHRNRKVKEA